MCNLFNLILLLGTLQQDDYTKFKEEKIYGKHYCIQGAVEGTIYPRI